MLTSEPTAKMVDEWKRVHKEYKNRLRANRKTGRQLLDLLQAHYALTELFEEDALQAIVQNVTQNPHLRGRLPEGQAPLPRAFFLENTGNGAVFYEPANKDPAELWGGDITRIFVGIDTASGYYMVEGSTLLWDWLCAFQGLDETDLENPYCVAEYIACLQRFGLLDDVLT